MAYEGDTDALATIEHLVPRGLGGSNTRSNCVSACRACNEARDGKLCFWRYRTVRRRLLERGAWPGCSTVPRRVAKLIRQRLWSCL